MSDPVCETCKGRIYVCAGRLDDPMYSCDGGEGCDAKTVCTKCSTVVSVSDAEVATAVREIEAEGLACWYTGTGWHVADCEDEPRQHGKGPTLPAALAAYRKAAKR